MRISTEDYSVLRDKLQEFTTDPNFPAWKTSCIQQGLTPMRMRWDLYWGASPRSWRNAQYDAGCNDSHIDTVLRKAMTELGHADLSAK